MRFRCFPIVCIAAMLGGCASSTPPKSEKELAADHWNQARAAVMISLAKDQYQTGNFDRSRETLTQAIELDPKNPNARVLSAQLAIEQGQMELADRELSVARNLDPNNAQAFYLSGVVYQRWALPQKAYEFYSEAYEKNPNELAYLMAKGEMLVAMDRSAEALALLEDKVTYFENSAVLCDAVGLLLMDQNRGPESIDMLRRATILAPDDLTIKEHLAMALYRFGQFADGADALNGLLKDDRYARRGDLWLTLGECQLQLRRPTDARDSFTTATNVEPEMASAWLCLGKAALALGDFRRADVSIHRALELEPDNSEAILLQGYLRMKQNRLADAYRCFGQANEMDRSDTVSLCMMGYVLQKMSRPDDAARCYARALKIKPADELATKLLAGTAPRE